MSVGDATLSHNRLERLLAWREANPDHARKNRMKRFGLTAEDYDRMFLEQDGRCAICLKPESVVDKRTGKVRSLAVDHDHNCCPEKYRACGKCVRGLLCQRCNNGLGQFQDNPDTLASALRYMGGTPFTRD